MKLHVLNILIISTAGFNVTEARFVHSEEFELQYEIQRF